MKNLKQFIAGSETSTITMVMSEAKVSTSVSTQDLSAPKMISMAKSAGIKLSIKKGAGDGLAGEDLGVFDGPDAKLIAFFKDYMGFEGRNIRDLKKEFDQ